VRVLEQLTCHDEARVVVRVERCDADASAFLLLGVATVLFSKKGNLRFSSQTTAAVPKSGGDAGGDDRRRPSRL